MKLRDALEDRTTHGNLVDQVLEALSEKQHAPYRQGFNVALDAAANKVSKYLQLLPFAKSARVLDPRQRAVLEMGSQVETYDCIFRIGDCSDALRAEWDVYWKLPAIASTQISVFWTSGRVCQRPSPYCMPWHTVHWQCLPLHATWSVASRP